MPTAMPQPGEPFPVHSTKYDGSLHYRWTPVAVAVRPEWVAVYMPPGGVFESYRGTFPAEHHHLLFCWAGADHNLVVSWHPDWRPRYHYVNITSAPSWGGGTIRFVDLDVDVVWGHGAPEPVLCDVDEMEANRGRFGYPAELVERCLARADAIRARMHTRAGLLDGRLYDWRPGRPLPEEAGRCLSTTPRA